MKGPSLYKGVGGMGVKGAIKNQKDYAGQADGRATSSPFQQKEKEEEKKEVNQWGETPEEYKQRMIEMGLRKADDPEDAAPVKQSTYFGKTGAEWKEAAKEGVKKYVKNTPVVKAYGKSKQAIKKLKNQ